MAKEKLPRAAKKKARARSEIPQRSKAKILGCSVARRTDRDDGPAGISGRVNSPEI